MDGYTFGRAWGVVVGFDRPQARLRQVVVLDGGSKVLRSTLRSTFSPLMGSSPLVSEIGDAEYITGRCIP